MRDDQGHIPIGAIFLANLFRRQQLLNLVPLPPVTGLSVGSKEVHSFSILNPNSWTTRGPQNVGGRTRSLLIDSNNPATMYAGAVSGGVWKSTNAGSTWTPLTDFMSNIAIMTMVFDTTVSDHSVIYAGTGELLYFRGDGIQGAGVFKGTYSAGNWTWTQLSDHTGTYTDTSTWNAVGRLAMNPNGVLLAAATSGIYRSTDGGAHWSRQFTSSDALTPSPGGLGLVVVFDPSNANNALAEVVDWDYSALIWRHKILYSTDAGVTWNFSSMPVSLTNYFDHVELAYSPSESGVVYANATTSAGNDGGELWKSINGGQSFVQKTMSGVTHCTSGACTIWVSPISLDGNILIVTGGQVGTTGNGGISRSSDGGVTVVSVGSGWGQTLSGDAHADQHNIVASPNFSSTNRQVYLCTDGGIFRADNISTVSFGNGSWVDLNQTYQTAQYHGATGNSASHAYVGGTQDNGTLVTTQSSTNASLMAGGDGGLAAIDPTDPNYVYGEFQWLDLIRSQTGGTTWGYIGRDGGTKPLSDSGSTTAAPFIGSFRLDPHNPATMIAGGTSLWRSQNVKDPVPNWDVIRSPGASVIVSVAVARSDSNVIWVAEVAQSGLYPSANGTIAKTTNGTSASPVWTTVRTQTSADGLPARGATSIYIDPDDPSTVYLTFGGFDGHSLYRTRNAGGTWTPIYGSGLNALPPAPARTVVRHPRNSNILFVGTDIGLYESDDSGTTWFPTQEGPADASVYEVGFVYGTDQLFLATHGRGLWTADTSTVTSNAPTNLGATYDGASTINVSWNVYGGATSYQLFRSSGGAAFTQIGGVIVSNSYPDSSLVSGTTYLYKVKAVVGGAPTDFSNTDLATAMSFTDDPLVVGSTIIKAIHLQELRGATNNVLTAAALPTINFGTVNAGDTIKASDISTIRSALVSAYYSIGLPIPAFSEGVIAGTTTVKANHFQELRNLVK